MNDSEKLAAIASIIGPYTGSPESPNPACYMQDKSTPLGSDGNIKDAFPQASDAERFELFKELGSNGLASVIRPACRDLGDLFRLAWVQKYSLAAGGVTNDNSINFDKLEPSLYFRAHKPKLQRPLDCSRDWYKAFRESVAPAMRRQVGGVLANDAASALVLAELS